MLHQHAPRHIQQRYLPALVAADIFPSFAMTEPDIVSSDPTGIKSKAVQDAVSGEWVINGRKWWTSGAAAATFTSVMVRTEFDEDTPIHLSFSVILVPTDNPGYRIQRSTHGLGRRGRS